MSRRAIARAEAVLRLALLLALPGCYASTAAFPAFQVRGVYARGAESKGVYREALRGDEVFSSVGFSRIEYGIRAGQQRLLDWPELPSFCAQLAPSSPPARIDTMSVELASRWLARFVPTPADRARGVVADEGDVFVGAGCKVGFDPRDGSVRWIAFEAGPVGSMPDASGSPGAAALSASPDAARIGPPDCDPLYTLPLNRAQLVEIFGEPDWEGWTRGEGNLLSLF